MLSKNAEILWDNVQPCYRAFKKEEYARAFVENGHTRICDLFTYTNIEDDTRRDENEGNLLFRDEQGKHFVSLNGFMMYPLCMSTSEVSLDHLKEKYGNWVVRINNPVALADDIGDALTAQDIKHLGIYCIKVKYTNEERPTVPQDLDSARAVYSFKHTSFNNDCECRIVVQTPHKKYTPLLELDLEKKLVYAELLPVIP